MAEYSASEDGGGRCIFCGQLLFQHGPGPHFFCSGQSKKDVPVRQFDTGATRNVEGDKFDYEGFLSPAVLERFSRYMHAHRKQRDGSLRDGDNWQKGIPREAYTKSLVRHTMDFWRLWRGGEVKDPDTGEPATAEDLACAIMFNIMGWLHETLKTNTKQKGATQ